MKSTWLRRFTTATEDGPRLVCFPHAGGSATAFKDLARRLPAHVDVVSVQYPGRQDRFREEPFTDLAALAEAVAEELARELAADARPYALFGHSMGSLVAFETARLLARQGLPAPQRLFFSGRGGPNTGNDIPYHLFDDDDVLADVGRLGGTDRSMLEDPDMLELVLPALRADYRALGTYRWHAGEPLTAPVTALIGDSDPIATVQDARTWGEHTTGDFTVRVFPGGHFYLFDHLDEVATALAEGLLAEAAAS
ncbi:thioesterase II family protein [Streptomyces sp. NPDC048192]|uniref:thioesterase II family protein n=1 Tax=Streptomyces sp. NPDC048192 TaxID=3365510 RepID=UPI00371F5186